jgi:hypothetical protein
VVFSWFKKNHGVLWWFYLKSRGFLVVRALSRGQLRGPSTASSPEDLPRVARSPGDPAPARAWSRGRLGRLRSTSRNTRGERFPQPTGNRNHIECQNRSIVRNMISHARQSPGPAANGTGLPKSAGSQGKYIDHQLVTKFLPPRRQRTVTMVTSRFARASGPWLVTG